MCSLPWLVPIVLTHRIVQLFVSAALSCVVSRKADDLAVHGVQVSSPASNKFMEVNYSLDSGT